jgi:hypothetical protein
MRIGFLALAGAVLVGCGGGGGNAFIGGDGGSGTVGAVNVSLGSGFSPFSEGLVEIDQASISAGGSTVIRVRVVQDDGAPFVQESLSATFSSSCSARGLGAFSASAGGAEANSFEFNQEGAISIIYTDQGCSASGQVVSNTISAQVVVDSGELQAQGTVSIQPGSAGSILLVSPTTVTELALRGGVATPARPQSANVDFRVVDDSGSQAPVQGQLVCFQLSTTVGGLELSVDQAITGSDGLARTTVRSGNVSTPVVVTASVAGPAASASCTAIPTNALVTQNDNIVVSTGLPDQDGFSIAAATLNPEAYTANNQTVPISVALNDLFNNPVRDGVSVSFVTEGGTIDAQCTTVNGGCTVNWVSNGDRPFDGRTTITAFTVGEESFVDANGNGLYDSGEAFGDVDEPLFDADENGVRSNGLKCPGETSPAAPRCIEEFEDFNSNSSYDLANGAFNGTRCATGCSADNSLFVWTETVLVMAQSAASLRVTPGSISIPQDGTVAVLLEVFGTMPDGSEQPMPAGTTIDVTTDVGTINGDSSFSVVNTNAPGPTFYVVTVADSGDAESGSFRVKVTSPLGLETSFLVPIEQP